MAGQGGGAIVNVGSIGGLRHLGHDHVGYSAGKSALVQFTRQIAVRYAREGIRCNTVIPGMIDTPLLEHRVSRQKGRADLETLRAHRLRRSRRKPSVTDDSSVSFAHQFAVRERPGVRRALAHRGCVDHVVRRDEQSLTCAGG